MERVISLGRELVRQARAAAATTGGQDPRERRLEGERRAAVLRHEADLRHHRGRIAGWRATMVGSAGVAAGLGLAAVQANTPADAVVLAGLTAGGAAMSWRARSQGKRLAAHPPVAQLPPAPPLRLRLGARGATEANRVAEALLTLYDLGPNVARLSPDAGLELWRAVSDVEPLLRGQVERLASLDRLILSMPGSRAAEAAESASQEIVVRVRAGAAALEELLAASIGLLAAPDIADAVPDVLAPAILSLQAYAHGLGVASPSQLPHA